MWNVEPIHKPYVVYDDATALLLKKLFAAAWLRNVDNPFAAAREVEVDHGKALFIAQYWVDDEDVLKERERLLSHYGPISKVPDKETFALEVYQTGKEARTGSEKLAAWKFFADLMDYTPRGGSGSGVNVNIQNNNMVGMKVMPVPVSASDDEWEKT